MTSTSASSELRLVPGVRDTATTVERRRPARFPRLVPPLGSASRTSSVQAAAQVLWIGPDGPLRDAVSDHAAAAGLLLADPAASSGAEVDAGDRPTLARVIAATALADAAPPAEEASFVVVADGPVPESVWMSALALGAEAVLRLPSESPALLERLAALHRPARGALRVGVVGGCGGAGASSFAARLAGALRAHGPVVLMDADPHGGGLDLLVEAPADDGVRWSDLAAIGPDDGQAMREGLPEVDGVRLLVAGPEAEPDPELLVRALAASSGGTGSTVVDLADDLVPAAAEQLDLLLVVVPTTELAVRATARRLRTWGLSPHRVRLVVRRSGPLDARDVIEHLGLSAVAAFRDGPAGSVPLLDVRRRGADRACRDLARALVTEDDAR